MSLTATEYPPQAVDQAGEVTEQGQDDVEDEMAGDSLMDQDPDRGEEDGDEGFD